jgi:TRAP-type C4-dicarboxylate transport system substrate-binding protein
MFIKTKLAVAIVGFGIAFAASAQQITLRLHQFLPPQGNVPKLFLKPWGEKIEKESGGRIKVVQFDAMALGGTPPQLYDQAKDGVVDIVWTVLGYTPGRFLRSEAFELPFVLRGNAENLSRAFWDYSAANNFADFGQVRPLALWVHGPGIFHMTNKPITGLADLKGLKIRAGNRQMAKYIEANGASAVNLPTSGIGDALSKGVVDGTMLPYEVVPALKVQELTKFTSETEGAIMYSQTFVLAMNKASYLKLPADLKKVIDNNSGIETSAWAGKVQGDSDAPSKKLVQDRGNTINVISAAEVAKMKEAGKGTIENWAKEVSAKFVDGKDLLKVQEQMIVKHAKK